MIQAFLFGIILMALVLGGIYLYQQFAGGVESVTARIKTRWLRITLRILLKTILFIFVVIGIISTAIVALAFSYDPKRKD